MKKLSKIFILTEPSVESNSLFNILSSEFNHKILISDKIINISLYNKYNLILIINFSKRKKLIEVLDFLKNCDYSNLFLIFINNSELNLKTEISYKVLNVPFSVNGLLEIINLNQTKSSEIFKTRFKIKNYIFFEGELKIIHSISKKIIKLTEMEEKFISYLLKSKIPLSKSKILKNVWGHKTNLETHTLESLVYRLRLKIEKDPKKPEIICLKEKKYFLST